MGLMRKLARNASMKDRYPSSFVYVRPDGYVGSARLRNTAVVTDIGGEQIVERFEALLDASPRSSKELSGASGTLITVLRMQPTNDLGLLFPTRYGLIYERRDQNVYVVYYVDANGNVRWITGQKRYTFSRVWDEFTSVLSSKLH